jgi:hypothetical protein
VSVGEGELPPETVVEEMTSLIDEVRDVPINNNKIIGDGRTQIEVVISNMNLSVGYDLREIGIWAIDNDDGSEILYSYTNFGEFPSYIYATGGPHAINMMYQLMTVIKQAPVVIVEITEGYGYITQDDLDSAMEQVGQAIGNITGQISQAINGIYGDPAPIYRFWTADEDNPRKLRPATHKDVIAYLFEQTASTDESVIIGYRPEDKGLFGIPLSRILIRSIQVSGGNPSMQADDYPDRLSGGNPGMVTADYEGSISGGDPLTV